MEQLFKKTQLDTISKILMERQQTIAVAESVTAGLLQNALASPEHAARFFQGGITAYNIGQKCRHLAVDPIHALSCDCVSERMASSMAISAARLFTGHWSIGVTGYATPVPASGNKLFAYFAIALNGAVMLCERIDGGGQPGLAAQCCYVETILEKLVFVIENSPR